MGRKVSVLNVSIDALSMDDALAILEQLIAKRKPSLVATANAEMVMLAQQDEELALILKQAALVVPDGAGVVWAGRYKGCNMPERVAGYDLVQRLLANSALKGFRVYLLGGAPGIAEKAKAYAESRYPGVCILGVRNGYYTASDEQKIVQEISFLKPDILLVALGVPKQEKWIARNLEALGVPVCIGVGGTFDVMAGVVKRAPLWMQRLSLEWLYRLLKQPQRALRMLALPKFAVKVLLEKKH